MDPEIRIHREEMLRRAVLSGDEAAWRTLYDESFATLYQFALWRCGGRREQADEVVQETWMTAVRQIRAFQPRQGSFLSWLRGIAANVRRNLVRHEQRLAHREQIAKTARAINLDHSLEIENQDRAQLVALALDALPERQEAVLRAKYFDDMSIAQIAAAWRQTPKAIESLLSRAREAFRELFERK